MSPFNSFVNNYEFCLNNIIQENEINLYKLVFFN